MITDSYLSYKLGLHGKKKSMETGILLKIDIVNMAHFILLVNLEVLTI